MSEIFVYPKTIYVLDEENDSLYPHGFTNESEAKETSECIGARVLEYIRKEVAEMAVSELQNENAELKAQVEQLRLWADRLSFELAHDETYETSRAFGKLQDALAETPTQCLSEIKAQAVEELKLLIIELAEDLPKRYNPGYTFCYDIITDCINQLRQGESK